MQHIAIFALLFVVPQCVVTQPEPWCCFWCLSVLWHSPSLDVVSGASVCCDTARAFMLFLVPQCVVTQPEPYVVAGAPVCCSSTGRSVCCDTAEALVFLLVPQCAVVTQPKPWCCCWYFSVTWQPYPFVVAGASVCSCDTTRKAPAEEEEQTSNFTAIGCVVQTRPQLGSCVYRLLHCVGSGGFFLCTPITSASDYTRALFTFHSDKRATSSFSLGALEDGIDRGTLGSKGMEE